jgi:hypothetical protein
VTDPNCMAFGCDSAAHGEFKIQAARSFEYSAKVCNLHKAELEKPDTKWMIDQDAGRFYVGEGLLKSNEYILLETPVLTGYGTGREFSHFAEDGLHVKFRVHRRGKDTPEDVVLVLTSKEMEQAIKHLGEMMP